MPNIHVWDHSHRPPEGATRTLTRVRRQADQSRSLRSHRDRMAIRLSDTLTASFVICSRSSTHLQNTVTSFSIALGRTFTVLLDPADIERVLVTDPDRFERFLFADEGFDFASKGILFNDNEHGDQQRHLMRPAFTLDRIQTYADTMVGYTAQTADEWTDGQATTLNRAFSDLTLRILSKTLFDIDIHSDGDVLLQR